MNTGEQIRNLKRSSTNAFSMTSENKKPMYSTPEKDEPTDELDTEDEREYNQTSTDNEELSLAFIDRVIASSLFPIFSRMIEAKEKAVVHGFTTGDAVPFLDEFSIKIVKKTPNV